MQTQRVLSFQIVLTRFCSFDRCEDGRTGYLKDGFWGGKPFLHIFALTLVNKTELEKF